MSLARRTPDCAGLLLCVDGWVTFGPIQLVYANGRRGLWRREVQRRGIARLRHRCSKRHLPDPIPGPAVAGPLAAVLSMPSPTGCRSGSSIFTSTSATSRTSSTGYRARHPRSVPNTWFADGQVSGDIVRAAVTIKFGPPLAFRGSAPLARDTCRLNSRWRASGALLGF